MEKNGRIYSDYLGVITYIPVGPSVCVSVCVYVHVPSYYYMPMLYVYPYISHDHVMELCAIQKSHVLIPTKNLVTLTIKL